MSNIMMWLKADIDVITPSSNSHSLIIPPTASRLGSIKLNLHTSARSTRITSRHEVRADGVVIAPSVPGQLACTALLRIAKVRMLLLVVRDHFRAVALVFVEVNRTSSGQGRGGESQEGGEG